MIVFCTTCRGRGQHIQETLPRNLSDNKRSKFVLLDYADREGLRDYIFTEHWQDIWTDRLVVYSYPFADKFRMSHAKNMVARLGMLEGADILVTLDADNFTGPGFEDFIEEKLTNSGIFLCPDFPKIKSLPHGPKRPQRGYAGRLAIRTQDFLKMGGYDETFDTWRGEDVDLIARMQRIGGYEMRVIDNHFLNAIPHDASLRFKEYPHAIMYETAGEWKRIYERTATVVNEGKIGCGRAYRNFQTPKMVGPVPTRIFGIGMHKTATTSLHEAFKILGYDSFHWETNKKAWDIFEEMIKMQRSPTLERYYALCDVPITMLYKRLDASYPGSKFILTIRNETNWLKSVEELWNPATNPYYDWHLQPYTHQLHRELYGRTDFSEATMLSRYRSHNAQVLDYFKERPQDLLVMDMENGAGWDELCQFVGEQIPVVPYPRLSPRTQKYRWGH